MLSRIGSRIYRAVSIAAQKVRAAVHELTRPLPVIGGLVADLTRTREELLAENVLLRQQLIIVSRKTKRPALRSYERGMVVLLASLVPRWPEAVLVVKPETVVRWHREGFRLFWRRKSRTERASPARVSEDTVELIHRLVRENRLWGAERIRGELLKLGVRVAKRTVQRHMQEVRVPLPPRGQSWTTFLRNHTVWACDFLQVYDVWFRPIFAFFIIDVNSKRIVRVAVTRAPTQEWTAQQLRNVTHFGEGPCFIIRDRDDKFGADFDRAARGAGIRVLRTAVRTPLMNATCERFLGSVRCECLDHIIIVGEGHLRAVLDEYVQYYNQSRPHQGIGQHVPVPSAKKNSVVSEKIVGVPVLGGLHHDYQRAA